LKDIKGIQNLDINKYIDVDCIYAGARQQHNKTRELDNNTTKQGS